MHDAVNEAHMTIIAGLANGNLQVMGEIFVLKLNTISISKIPILVGKFDSKLTLNTAREGVEKLKP